MNRLSTDDHIKRGEIFAKSLFFGSLTPEQGATISIICEEAGKSVGEWMATNNIVHDRPAMKADAMLAGLLDAGCSYTIDERSPDRAAITMTGNGSEFSAELTWDDIKDESFTWIWNKKKQQKERNPKYMTPRSRMQMLWARLISDAVRAYCPTVCKGVYTPEEIADFDAPAIPEPPTPRASEATGSPRGESSTSPKPTTTPTPPSEATGSPRGEPTDYTLMPMGGKKGTPFADMALNELAVVLKAAKADKPEAINANHIPHIEAAIAAKEA